MNITLSSELEKIIDEKMKGGGYANPNEVIRAALEALQEQEDLLTPPGPEQVRREISTAVAQLDRGEGIPWDVEALKAKGRALLAARRAQAEPGQQ
jgi:antitoxin ParD1/3/4